MSYGKTPGPSLAKKLELFPHTVAEIWRLKDHDYYYVKFVSCTLYSSFPMQCTLTKFQNTAFCAFPVSRRDSGKQVWIMSVVEMV